MPFFRTRTRLQHGVVLTEKRRWRRKRRRGVSEVKELLLQQRPGAPHGETRELSSSNGENNGNNNKSKDGNKVTCVPEWTLPLPWEPPAVRQREKKEGTHVVSPRSAQRQRDTDRPTDLPPPCPPPLPHPEKELK
ncbi:uncharacterized protein LOC143322116 isoform X2 [Chaetodon auriga]|uniref:uncharacterized protein LOC143322116 isoform X2 n=1 Tax=Chaetodon auriga TaxID=39042 RepID=UPI004032A734